MKRYLSVIYLIVVMGIMNSCFFSSPESTALDYLQFRDSMNYKAAYNLLCEDDKKSKTFEEYSKVEKFDSEIGKILLERFKDKLVYKVKSIEKGDITKVSVMVTEPDMSEILASVYNIGDALSMIVKSKKRNLKEFRIKLDKYISETSEIPCTNRIKIVNLIKEHGRYRVFKNFSFPEKKRNIRKRLSSLINELRYEDARDEIVKFQKKTRSDKFSAKLESVNKVLRHRAFIGESVINGYIEFEPLSVEVAKAEVFHENYKEKEPEETEERFFILKFRVRNISKGQVFAPLNVKNTLFSSAGYVKDNLKNKMKSIRPEPGKVFNKNRYQKLQPDQEAEYFALCKSPVNEEAKKYLWKVKLRVNNSDNKCYEYFYVSFKDKDIDY